MLDFASSTAKSGLNDFTEKNDSQQKPEPYFKTAASLWLWKRLDQRWPRYRGHAKTMTKHVKSKHRVAQYGEVLTPEHIVNAMLDLVKQETERNDSRFLEPACWTGNFFLEIFGRKLSVVESRYGKSQPEYERHGTWPFRPSMALNCWKTTPRNVANACLKSSMRRTQGFSGARQKRSSRKRRAICSIGGDTAVEGEARS